MSRRFLSLPRAEPEAAPRPPAPQGSPEAARQLWAMARPLAGTLAEAYLHAHGINDLRGCEALRFHLRCDYRLDEHTPTATWPAMIAVVTALSGAITGVHLTWLAPDGLGKAPIDTPRRAMGVLLGHAVRFGVAGDVLAAGEGIETMLSLRCAMPAMPMAAALSASHLAALQFPPALRRLYIARDADAAGETAVAALTERAQAADVETLTLVPALDDFNEDLCRLGAQVLRNELCAQLAPDDRSRVRST